VLAERGIFNVERDGWYMK